MSGVPYRAIFPNSAPFIPTSRDEASSAKVHQPPYGSVKKSGGSSTSPAGGYEETTFLIIDAQSVQNADTAMEKGYDAGKKVSGIKRHIAVDTQGLPHPLR